VRLRFVFGFLHSSPQKLNDLCCLQVDCFELVVVGIGVVLGVIIGDRVPIIDLGVELRGQLADDGVAGGDAGVEVGLCGVGSQGGIAEAEAV